MGLAPAVNHTLLRKHLQKDLFLPSLLILVDRMFDLKLWISKVLIILQNNETCLDSGPNGNLGILTSTNGGYLFEQECKTYSGESGKP